jgi:hypothetical protein
MATERTKTRKATPKDATNSGIEAEVQKWLELLVPMLADKFIAERLSAEESHPALTHRKAKGRGRP